MQLVLSSSVTYAGFDSGNDLLKLLKACDKRDAGGSVSDGMGCMAGRGYVSAVYDSHEVFVQNELISNFYCAPIGVQRAQLGAVVLKYLNDNPAELHMSAAALVINAFGEAWPCS